SFIARRNGESVIISTLPPVAAEMGAMQDAAGRAGGNFYFDRADLVSRDITLREGNPLVVKAYLSLSAREAFLEFDLLQVQIFLISIVAIVAILLIGRVGAQRLSTPLRQLAKKAARIAEGDFKQEIQESKSIAEIGELSRAFVSMQQGLAEREEKILYQSSHDVMTGLYNRQFAITRLDQLLADTENSAGFLAVVINVRQFKLINESFGHQIGDLCLMEVAHRLWRHYPDTIAARIAGDEFFLVIPKTGGANELLLQLENHLSGECQIDSLQISLRFSFGVADSSRDGDSASQLLERASIAQDRARREQDAFVFYDHRIEEEHKKRILLLNDLKGALSGESEQLHVYFQPKVGFADTREYRFEALLRWIHPEQGFVSPEYFIPLAEQAGLITRITDWVIEQVVLHLADWKSRGLTASVAINLSAKDLARPGILDLITLLLEQHGLPAAALSFEITESDIMSDAEAAIALLHRFRGQGFDVAIDDFGTGYSSLSQLKHMPVSELKIDKAFVLNLDSSTDDQIIVRSTLLLARQFNLKVVAEGVENQQSLSLLQQWGCHWIQGFYLSKPLPARDILEWMASKPASLANAG
ncbi:MAG: EAL domain-containing protein, partial [Ketobacteraceae bacterium]|nr:EAL domain-containing protein [Ketobacteraceae bacterium]